MDHSIPILTLFKDTKIQYTAIFDKIKANRNSPSQLKNTVHLASCPIPMDPHVYMAGISPTICSYKRHTISNSTTAFSRLEECSIGLTAILCKEQWIRSCLIWAASTKKASEIEKKWTLNEYYWYHPDDSVQDLDSLFAVDLKKFFDIRWYSNTGMHLVWQAWILQVLWTQAK